jgi:hypothetical protein
LGCLANTRLTFDQQQVRALGSGGEGLLAGETELCLLGQAAPDFECVRLGLERPRQR